MTFLLAIVNATIQRFIAGSVADEFSFRAAFHDLFGVAATTRFRGHDIAFGTGTRVAQNVALVFAIFAFF